MSSWQTGEALAGPAFVAWLEETEPGRLREDLVGASTMRRVSDWRRGAHASVWAADRVLTLLGRHLSEVPDAVWSEPARLLPTRLTPERRLHLLDALRRGTATKAIARGVGCSPSTVRYWRRKVAA